MKTINVKLTDENHKRLMDIKYLNKFKTLDEATNLVLSSLVNLPQEAS